MSEEQDKTHRLLFYFPQMIKDLIRLYLGGDWIEHLDFDSLERVPERLLSKELVRREQDVLWRLKYLSEDKREAAMREEPKRQPRNYLASDDIEYLETDEYFYIYLHLEHQSRPRVRMALDMATYKLLALQDLTRHDFRLGDKLPTIFQMVFYNGEGAWNVPTSLLEMLRTVKGAPEGLDFWSYKLIDAQRLNLEELVGADSPLLGLLRLEQLGSLGDLEQVANELKATLGPEHEALEEAFVTFINEAVLPRLTLAGQRRLRIDDLQEMPAMVTQRIERLTQALLLEGEEKGRREGRTEGRKEGRTEGRREGRTEGEAIGLRKGELAMLRRLLERRFGNLSAAVVERLERADVDLLLEWSDRLLTAKTLDQVFEE